MAEPGDRELEILDRDTFVGRVDETRRDLGIHRAGGAEPVCDGAERLAEPVAVREPGAADRQRARTGIDAGDSPVTSRSSASTSGISCRSGRNAPIFSISGAAFTSALSAMPGMDAWPLRPRTRRRNGALCFSAGEQK